jgi:hypothetical protein
MHADIRRQLVYVASALAVFPLWWFIFEDLAPGWAVIIFGFAAAWIWNAVLDSDEAYRHMQEAETSSHEPAYGDARGEGEEDE